MMPLADMQFHIPIFFLLMAGAMVYALGWGGAAERIAALLMALALWASIHVHNPDAIGFHEMQVGLFLVDLALFVALYLLSVFSTRFWPIWIAAMQGMAVLAHAVKLIPGPMGFGYAVLEEFWAFPQLILLIVAVYRHRKRLRRNGTDPSWIASFAPSELQRPR